MVSQMGARVLCVDLENRALSFVEAVGLSHTVTPACLNVTDLPALKRFVSEQLAQRGVPAGLVNLTFSSTAKTLEELTEEDWDKVVDVDLKGVFFCSVVFGRRMIAQGGGKIINIASILGLGGDKQVLPYCVAKGGVVQMTRALALEWAKHNIQVNALCPGYVKTTMNEADIVANERIYKHIVGKTPMRRLGEVGELVGPLVFLASDASSYMTGQTLVIDGGWTAE